MVRRAEANEHPAPALLEPIDERARGCPERRLVEHLDRAAEHADEVHPAMQARGPRIPRLEGRMGAPAVLDGPDDAELLDAIGVTRRGEPVWLTRSRCVSATGVGSVPECLFFRA